MSGDPVQWYQDLPVVAKTYGTLCLMTTGGHHLGLYNPWDIALSYEAVVEHFQVWRLVTNFFFLGPFSYTLLFHLVFIASYGVQLERGPFYGRTADYLWMLIFGAFSLLVMAAIIPFLHYPLISPPVMACSLVFMIIYVWSREFPNVNFHGVDGLFQMKGLYLPVYLLVIDLILGNPLTPILLGIAAGYLYYSVCAWHTAARVYLDGRRLRQGETRASRASTQAQPSSSEQAQRTRNQANDGIAFRGRSRHLDDHQ